MGFFRWLRKLFIPSHHNAYRPHLLRRGSLMFLLGLALVAEGVLVANLMVRQEGDGFLATVIQSEIISLTNAERMQNDAAAVKENLLLDQSAQAKADDMAKYGYFAHKDTQGRDPWAWIDAAGYDYRYAGENLAVRFVDSKDVVVAWMASPTHRANIVKPVYTEVGVGIAQGLYQGQPATFVVQHFGRPAVVSAAVEATTSVTAVSVATTTVARAQPVEVLGAQTIVPPPPSFSDSLARQLGRILSEPRASTAWVLSSIALLLTLALAFTFFHHIQIQARDLLLPGAVVASIALALLVINNNVLSSAITVDAQQAAVGGYQGVLLTPEAASLER